MVLKDTWDIVQVRYDETQYWNTLKTKERNEKIEANKKHT
jgi:hypothetical protein